MDREMGMDADRRADMILVGQTPPPFHGQALGIKAIAEYPFRCLRVRLVRMEFSEELAAVGRLRPSKVVHLVKLAYRIVTARHRTGARVLYYPPAGPSWTPVIRDLLLLPVIRPFFARTVLHYRAAGLGAWLAQRGPLVRWLARRAYGNADLAILMSARLQENIDGILQARRTVVIANGVVDLAGARRARVAQDAGHILFVGALRPEKGVDVLLEALVQLHQQEIAFHAKLVGKLICEDYRKELIEKIDQTGIASKVTFCGEITGEDLSEMYVGATLFCLPSQYASEAMPRVVIEAMQFGLPIVATDWRGIPDMIQDGVQGILVPVGDAAALAQALLALLQNTERRQQMGEAARKRYESGFTIERQMLAFEGAVVAMLEGGANGK